MIRRFLYFVYERLLQQEIRKGVAPTHLGIILDGNRRYAREMGFEDISEGHREGARKLDEVLQWCVDLNIRIITIWVLSPDNVNRDKDEVEALFGVIRDKMNELSQNEIIRSYKFRIKVFGKLDRLPEDVKEAITRSEESTKDHDQYILNMAIGYGGREEIVDAVKMALAGKQAKSVDELAQGLTAEDITKHLYTSGIPDPDLIIRTSGEVRMSGFLLWQSAYSEFYFCDALWPAFRRIDFLRAIRSFQHRTRRFGR
ncbi:MAG TPA: di-trans,poly-cis-decaprenylcistransferase [Deltaproteobacteria bacterium]|nr:di-trans,poly-cis-decaprenylcistransferase [Deltaproteobacteria bacterium]